MEQKRPYYIPPKKTVKPQNAKQPAAVPSLFIALADAMGIWGSASRKREKKP